MIKNLKLKIKNYFPKFGKVGFAGIELILLVTIVAGIAAATRLAGEVQNLQKQAAGPCTWNDATGKCSGQPPPNCYNNTGGGACFYIGSCTSRTSKQSCTDWAICNSDGCDCNPLAGACAGGGGPAPTSGSATKTPTKTPTSNPTTCVYPDYCSPGDPCNTGDTNIGTKDCPSKGKAFCCKTNNTGGGSSLSSGNACTWNGTKCVGIPAVANCTVDTGGHECISGISTCDTPTHNQGKAWCPTGVDVIGCLADPASYCTGGSNPPPDGGNPPGGGGYNICDAGFDCKLVGNCPACDNGGCASCIKRTGLPSICCPLTNPPPEPPPVNPPPNPPNPTIAPRECSDELSDAVCAPLKENAVCDAAGTTCINFNGIVDQQNPPQPKCTCGTPPPNPTATNTPTLTPTLTPTPTIDPDAPGWFTSYGTRCNAQSYRAFYNDINDCENTDAKPLGYQTENLPGVDPCTAINGIKCYAAIGDKLDSLPGAYKLEKDNICNRTEDNVDNPITKDTEILNEFRECQYKDPPKGQITTNITAIFDDKNKFDQIVIFLVDNNETGKTITLKNKSFSHADFQTNKTQTHNFEKVFTDRSYNVYAKILKKVEGGIVNDTSPGIEIIYECTNGENSGEAACTFPAGEGEAKITVNFPKKSDGDDDFDDLSGQALNNIFMQKIDAWTRGDLNAIQMSEFLLKVKDAPGLKTATCDPTVPGGCQPVF